MIVHLVLFKPRPDASEAERRGLADALTAALREIPSVRRVQVGRRVTHGLRPYEAMMQVDYSYAASLEFDDVAGLQAYLEHPAHEQLAARFFTLFEQALMYDYDLQDGAEAVAALTSSP